MIPPLVQGAGPGSVNIGVLGDLARRSDTMLAIFSDRLNHASLIDGIRTIRPQVSHLGTYDHDDAGVDRLREELEQYAEDAARVIVTDGVFSMEGDQAPLQTLVNLAVEFGALLIVDDPHGTGVLGARGCGSIEAQGVLGEVDVITSTIDKALGGAGADSSPVRPRSRQLCARYRGHTSSPTTLLTRSSPLRSPPLTFWKPTPARSRHYASGSCSFALALTSSV